MVAPIQMPVNNERSTCLLTSVRIIAKSAGRRLIAPYVSAGMTNVSSLRSGVKSFHSGQKE
jgi:hypothetical protein